MSKYGWVSLGAAGFKGTFDGMGHTITAMSYKDESQAKAWGYFIRSMEVLLKIS